MVKIKALSILIGLFLVLLMVPAVFADNENGDVIRGGKLLITQVDAKVDGKSDKSLDFDEKISKEAKPGSNVEFTIELKNNFTDAQDLEIQDIDTTITIEEIDDGDDLDEDVKQFDLKADDDKKVKVTFDIPLEVDEDNYNVVINAEGEDENGTTHEVEYRIELEIQKEDNEVIFLRNDLAPSEVKCARTVQLSTAVINTGADDEDGVSLEASNTDLSISFKENFDLTNDAFEDDSKFRKTFTFTVPSDTPTGIYPITSKVLFNDLKDSKTDTKDIVVGVCDAVQTKETPKPAEENKGEVVVVQQPTQPTVPTGSATAQPVTAPTLPTTEEKSLFQSSGFLAALVAGEVLLVIIAILIVVAVIRKRS